MRSLFHMVVILSMCCGCTTSLFDSRLANVRTFGLEQRVINQFADALREDNEPALRRAVSVRFEQKALRSPTAFQDLEILGLPKGQLTVIESDELDRTKRQLVVTEKDNDQKYQYVIVRDQEKRRWVVDDVVLRQQKKGARGTKSSTEVMDLLLTLREFLETWKGGERDEMLRLVADDLRSSLEQLPEPWLRQLVGRVAAEYETSMARRPEAQLNETDAVVKMPARNGFLLVKIAREADGWLVSDVEVHSRRIEDHPGSVHRQSEAIRTATRFLKSYQTQDQDQLQAVTTSAFYEGALQFADLGMLSLSPPDFAPTDFELRSYTSHLTVLIPENTRLIRLDLIDPLKQTDSADPSPELLSAADKHRFVVREVAIFDRKTMQQTNLSSAFSAPARAMLFMSALEERDLPMLRSISTREFSKGTWDRIPPEFAPDFAIKGLPRGEITLQNSQVRGRKTELEFLSEDSKVLSVILVEEDDKLRVDDLQFPGESAQIVSLKTQLELKAPLLELASAWLQADLNGVRKACSAEFNRLVWSNVALLPGEFSRLPDLLSAPIERTQHNRHQATVLMRSNEAATTVQLQLEKGVWVVDEISMVNSAGQSVQIRSALRKEIAQKILQNPPGSIQRAAYSLDSQDDSGRTIVPAHAESTVPLKGNLTLPSPRMAAARDAGPAAIPSPVSGIKLLPTPAVPTTPAVPAAAESVSPVPDISRQINDDGDHVILFGPHAAGGTDRASTPSEASTPSATAPSAAVRTSRITRPAEHPIEIPFEQH